MTADMWRWVFRMTYLFVVIGTIEKKNMESYSVIFLDFESCDFSGPYDTRATELAAILLNPDHTSHEFKSYIKADKPVSAECTDKTGITNDMLVKAPPCPQVLHEFFDFIRIHRTGPVILAAHNGQGFDFPLLMSEMHRWDINLPRTFHECHVKYLFDTLTWFRKHVPPHMCIKRDDHTASYELGDLYEALYEKRMDNAHEALADTKALRDICQHEYCRDKLVMDDANGLCSFLMQDLIHQFKQRRHGLDQYKVKKTKRKRDALGIRKLNLKRRKVNI
jgi:DNA polymerase III epsilon subunit-like protein